MAADQKLLLTTQPEKPNHYTYLKEFRVDQCQSFLQHKCNQHRPFICFNWHFMNQRRRRPVRKRDGTFNYSADNYCTKYDETTGICPDGDDCPFLHRTAGDTERRYHLRYYKTCMCVHDTDARGYCVKNGHHCAFAHGPHDQRPPVYDTKELEALQLAETNGEPANGPNALDKERNLMNEDPKWQDTNYVLANYKTEPCKRPPRLCRQGYACPQYHNSKDKRRSPRKYKYRSTPCPNVKHGEEWGEPANCEAGDNCQYCHTRTEQQFHPEIYKSTKCNDVQQAGYCPRSVFCAFAHVEPYILSDELQARDFDGASTNLAICDLLSNTLPLDLQNKKSLDNANIINTTTTTTPSTTNNIRLRPRCFETDTVLEHLSNNFYFDQSLLTNGGSAESSESASTSSVASNGSHSKAPGAQLSHKSSSLFQNNNCGGGVGLSSSGTNNHSAMQSFGDFAPDLGKQLLDIENDPLLGIIEKEQRKRMCLTFSLQSMGPLERISKNTLSELGRRNDLISGHIDNSISAGIASSSILQNSSAPVNIPSSSMSSKLCLLQGTSAPVNIPGSSMTNFSSPNQSNIFSVPDPFSPHLSGSAPKINNSLSGGHQNDGLFYQPHIISPNLGETLSISPDLRMTDMSSMCDEINQNSNSLFDNNITHAKQSSFSMSPCLNQGLPDQIGSKMAHMMNWEEQIRMATKACEAWKQEIEECNRKTVVAEQQRDEALEHLKVLNEKLEMRNLHTNGSVSSSLDLKGMSLHKLKSLQVKLRTDLEEVESLLYSESAKKCLTCEENNRSVTLVPCNHYVVCDSCASTARECPYCQTTITSQT